MKYALSYAFAASSALAPLAAAHATFQQLWVNGVDQASKCARLPYSNSPIENLSSNDMRCNVNTAAAAGLCDVKAGDVVTVEMHQHNNRDCSQEAIGGAHLGPVMVYLSKVDDAAKADGSSPFFKIFESGYFANNKTWGNDLLNANCGKQNVVIPADIAPGDYLLRAETIALHVAMNEGGAQFYMTCYQIRVTGSGTATPPGVTFPGAYSATDPGILFNLYNGVTSYQIPGPAVYSAGAAPGGGSSSSSSSAPPASAPSTSRSGPGSVPTTFLTRTSSRAPATASSSSTAPVPTGLPDDDNCDAFPVNSTATAPVTTVPRPTNIPDGGDDYCDDECDAEPDVSSTASTAPTGVPVPIPGSGSGSGSGSGNTSPTPTAPVSTTPPGPTVKDIGGDDECDAEPVASSTSAGGGAAPTNAPANGAVVEDDNECDAEPVVSSTSAGGAVSTNAPANGSVVEGDDECDAEPVATTTTSSTAAPSATGDAEECDA